MAFADYFDKNAQAAALLLKGIQTDAFKTILEAEVIGIAFDGQAMASAEGHATLDLTVRLMARLYPTVALIAQDKPAAKHRAALAALATAINPNIAILESIDTVTRWIVVGATTLRASKRRAMPTFYIGSDNWITRLSATQPVACGTSSNPFGAGVAACLGAANVFRSVFAAQLPLAKLDAELAFSVLELDPLSKKPKNPPFKRVDLGLLHLVGAGAVGNGFLWALMRLECTGDLHVVDAEALVTSNLQRYVYTVATDVDKDKTALAVSWNTNKQLQVHPHKATWDEYVTGRGDWKFDRIAVAVDSAQARIQIQGSLPRKVFNSWTQAGEVGVSRHDFLSGMACLACLYMPREQTVNYDQIVLRALKLPEHPVILMDVRTRLEGNLPTERAFLDMVAANSDVAIEHLLPYEGKPLRQLYVEAICGGAVLAFGGGDNVTRTDVPMAFQSALAGVLLAADVVADVATLRKPLPTLTQIDLLRAFPQIPSHPQKKHQGQSCICGDANFTANYRTKYPSTETRLRKWVT
jgi:hypothetical protein